MLKPDSKTKSQETDLGQGDSAVLASLELRGLSRRSLDEADVARKLGALRIGAHCQLMLLRGAIGL